jgi:hypothetical protein
MSREVKASTDLLILLGYIRFLVKMNHVREKREKYSKNKKYQIFVAKLKRQMMFATLPSAI